MASEAVVFPQDLFGYGCKDLYSFGGGGWSYDSGLVEEDKARGEIRRDHGPQVNWDSSSSSMVQNVKENNSLPEDNGLFTGGFPPMEAPATTSGRRKRRRTKSCKNKDEVENQRMTHIAVERNRRKQMNEYLTVLRSLMPASYVRRVCFLLILKIHVKNIQILYKNPNLMFSLYWVSVTVIADQSDQASVVGGAINFVKELEQLLQSLEAQKRINQKSEAGFSFPFADFFIFPQYSTCSTHCNNSAPMDESMAENRSAIANIEVTMVESHANLKILSWRRSKQLLKMVAGFQSLLLTILHLNVTTVDQMVLYSFSVKVEENCQLTSVDEIVTAVYQMLGSIQEESVLS
ncbi:hypothetical protein HHK36_003955 [Tetracentron sinense]|uniref:BHLH domain-containing protein n=1 Tax=Tetracentron sinense TaxID=13715 RepID=A0A835DPT9_TETSI|nr:hypothetical protein HHK36_003955 [Tetracentron sinense]